MSTRNRKLNLSGLNAVSRGLMAEVIVIVIAAIVAAARLTGAPQLIAAVILLVFFVLSILLIVLGLSSASRFSGRFLHASRIYFLFLAILGAGICAAGVHILFLGQEGEPLSRTMTMACVVFLLVLILLEGIGFAATLSGCSRIAGQYEDRRSSVWCSLIAIAYLVLIVLLVVLAVLFLRNGAAVVTEVIEEHAGGIADFNAFYGRMKPFVIMLLLFAGGLLARVLLRAAAAGRIQSIYRKFHGKARQTEIAG